MTLKVWKNSQKDSYTMSKFTDIRAAGLKTKPIVMTPGNVHIAIIARKVKWSFWEALEYIKNIVDNGKQMPTATVKIMQKLDICGR